MLRQSNKHLWCLGIYIKLFWYHFLLPPSVSSPISYTPSPFPFLQFPPIFRSLNPFLSQTFSNYGSNLIRCSITRDIPFVHANSAIEHNGKISPSRVRMVVQRFSEDQINMYEVHYMYIVVVLGNGSCGCLTRSNIMDSCFVSVFVK